MLNGAYRSSVSLNYMFNHVAIPTQESNPTVSAHTIDNVMIMFETPTYNRVLRTLCGRYALFQQK